MHYWLATDDPPRLLLAVMRHFQGDGSVISFEGGLTGSRLEALHDCGSTETAQLKRNTSAPRLDFLVAPLSFQNVDAIMQAVQDEDLLAEEGGLIHVQIAAVGRLVFGAYDSFHPDCVFVYGIPAPLRDEGVLREFGAHDA